MVFIVSEVNGNCLLWVETMKENGKEKEAKTFEDEKYLLSQTTQQSQVATLGSLVACGHLK